MKFLCLGYLDPNKIDVRPKPEIDAILRECMARLDALYDTGRVLVDAGLTLQRKRLRRARGKVTVTDGPFTETKEVIGSVFIVDARDMDEAIRVASLHPSLQLDAGEQFDWGIEIRPIHYFKQPELGPRAG